MLPGGLRAASVVRAAVSRGGLQQTAPLVVSELTERIERVLFMNTTALSHRATLYRMVTDQHVCPYGLKAKDLLHRKGFAVEDRWLRTRDETDAFKADHHVKTTPQIFIDGQRVGGYDDLRRHLGEAVPDPKAVTYKPVVAVFAVTALMALAASSAAFGNPLTVHAAEWFVAFSMCVLGILKLQNIDTFSSMFLGYDLLARRWVPYAYVYPFAEALAGILMVSGRFPWLSIRSRPRSAASAPPRFSKRSTSTSASSNALASVAAATCPSASSH